MDNEHHGIFDDDPALDCILLEEAEKEEKKGNGGSGCCVVFLTLSSATCWGIAQFII